MSGPPYQHNEITVAVESIQETGAAIDALVADLSDMQIRWKPSPESWSIGQCLEHMALTTGKLIPVLEQSIREGGERKASGPFRYGWIARFFIKALRPNASRVKVQKIYAPTQDTDSITVESARSHWHDVHRRFIEVMGSADGLDLGAIKATSPAARFLRLPIGAWFEAIANHDQRHFQQAERVRQHEGFPATTA